MNKVLLVGRIGKDPEMRTTQHGNQVCSFSVAVDRRTNDANGNRQVDWINCVAWRKTAEFVGNYFGKGSRIGIEGALQTRSYTAQDGSSRHVCEVMVDSVEFVDSKKRTASESDVGLDDGYVEVNDDELPF